VRYREVSIVGGSRAIYLVDADVAISPDDLRVRAPYVDCALGRLIFPARVISGVCDIPGSRDSVVSLDVSGPGRARNGQSTH
jgi:hypothetical protein